MHESESGDPDHACNVVYWQILLQKSAAGDGRRLSRYEQPALIRRR
jgi:hypothetical protein